MIVVLFILWPPQDPVDSGVELDLNMENKLSQKQPVLKIEVTLESCLCSSLTAIEVFLL